MPIGINGNGTITGVTVGGLPDGIVDTDMLAADSVTAPKIGSKTFTSYAIIADQKASGSQGGAFTAGAWRTRDLNTELVDPDGIVSISSNQFTLQAGSYLIEAQAPSFAVLRHIIKLYQTSGTPADIAFGTAVYNNSVYNDGVSVLKARVTISTATTYEIRHRCQTTNSGATAMGVSSNFGNTELYTVVKIFKEA